MTNYQVTYYFWKSIESITACCNINKIIRQLRGSLHRQCLPVRDLYSMTILPQRLSVLRAMWPAFRRLSVAILYNKFKVLSNLWTVAINSIHRNIFTSHKSLIGIRDCFVENQHQVGSACKVTWKFIANKLLTNSEIAWVRTDGSVKMQYW